MIRGIAVMRRRNDSFVNATQILKVAGVDKGRRTKILEKEILPGKHEIVQGGYGKYQGTWIPLERGRDIAYQYGVAPLLAPLFDFQPTTNSLGSLPSTTTAAATPGTASPRPLSASSSYSNLAPSGSYASTLPSTLAPPPIMPGSALRLLNQGRAQGLFTPSTTSAGAPSGSRPGFASPGPFYPPGSFPPSMPYPASSTPPPSNHSLKRNRSEADDFGATQSSQSQYSGSASHPLPVDSGNDSYLSVPPGTSDDNPAPTKKLRRDPTPLSQSWISSQRTEIIEPSRPSSALSASGTLPTISKPSESSIPMTVSSATLPSTTETTNEGSQLETHNVRLATKPAILRSMDPSIPLKDTRRTAIIALICQADDANPVLDMLREVSPPPNFLSNPAVPPSTIDFDTVLDDQGHTALHLAASMARLNIVKALIQHGADIHRGNRLGETPLIRACLATHNFDQQTFDILVSLLHSSIRTLDTSCKSVLHHVVSLAGVKGRAVAARYYLDQIFIWIAERQGGDFKSIVDLQDEHGDTALNIAARVGNRSLVRTLLDVGANRVLPNKLGLKPGDFGVEVEELSMGLKAEDVLAGLRTGLSAPVQKSQDVISEITNIIHSLSTEFQSEIKSKQDALDVTQAHLRAATRELADKRRQIQVWQAKCGEMDQIAQRVRNVEKAIEDEEGWDWSGRSRFGASGSIARDGNGTVGNGMTTLVDGGPASSVLTLDPEGVDFGGGPAFKYLGPGSTTIGIGGEVDVSSNLEVDPPFPPLPSLTSTSSSTELAPSSTPPPSTATPTDANLVATLIRLRRMKMWHERVETLMKKRLSSLQGASAEKEYQCKKIVALCTGIPVDKVEDMLENLVIAVESESQIVDIGRVSGFMQKVRDGII
ncbi:hypothetical protein AX16_003907 [Volvariella volvacea WC 439]|nr:hypothetical protein AX16_003907 [Volvariella volvacea WC 439]